MHPDFARFLLAGTFALLFTAYGLYVGYIFRRAQRRVYAKAARQTLADAVALVQLHGNVAPPEHRHLYADLSRRLKEMPLE